MVSNERSGAIRLSSLIILVLLETWLLYPVCRSLMEYWDTNEMYSYGYLVPFISAGLIWGRRDQLSRIEPKPSLVWGGALLALGLLALVVGQASSTNLLQWMSIPTSISGTCLLILGTRMSAALAFPLGYLVAMIPFWDFLTVPLQPPFQLYSAIIGVAAVRPFGVPVFREGIFIYLPNITLEVADVCSGINQLVAILCIGIAATHLYVRRWTKRLLILTAAIGIALMSNGLRVALVTLYASYEVTGSGGDVHGPYSMLRTLAISAIGYAALFALIVRFADRDPSGGRESVNAPAAAARGTVHHSAVVLALAMVAATLAFQRSHSVTSVSPSPAVAVFPTTLAGWSLIGDATPAAAVAAIGFDHLLTRNYTDSAGREVELVVGYFEQQRQGHELVGYDLSGLLAADVGPFTYQVTPDVRVKDLLTTVSGERYYVAYWYLLPDGLTANEYRVKWSTVWGSLIHRRNDGGIVLVKTKITRADSLDSCRSRLTEFVGGLAQRSASFVGRS